MGAKVAPIPQIPGSGFESAELWLSCLRELGLYKLLMGLGGDWGWGKGLRRNREGVVRLPQHCPGQEKSLPHTPRCGIKGSYVWGWGYPPENDCVS